MENKLFSYGFVLTVIETALEMIMKQDSTVEENGINVLFAGNRHVLSAIMTEE